MSIRPGTSTPAGAYQPVDHTWSAGLEVKAGQIVEHSGTLYKVDADMTLPGSFNTTGLTAVGGGGASSPSPPAAYAKANYDSGGTITSAEVDVWGGSSTPLANGDPSGVPWLQTRDNGSLYLDIDTPVFVEVYVGTDGTIPVHVTWRGNGPLGAVDVVVPAGAFYNSGRGVIPGCPAGSAGGGAGAEPGWDPCYFATIEGDTAITFLGVAVYPLP